MSKSGCDYLIVGGGVVGLTIARELIARGADGITIVEKEQSLAMHGSGRNSGVMHAGIYYPAGTMKARFCLEGGKRMKAFCRDKGLPVHETGKVIVTRDESEIETLHELEKRSTANGAKVDLIDEQQLAEYEPNAKTTREALYSHYTAVVDPKLIMQALHEELQASGKVTFLLGTRFIRCLPNRFAETSSGDIQYRTLINAAGSFADKVAHAFGIAKHLSLMPFKGIYHKLKPEHSHLCNGNIYPVPNIHNPFLGVHFTKNIHGDVYLGPTAIPALGRENYGLLQGADSEAFKLIWQDFLLFCQNKKFRQVALTEPKKYLKKYFFNDCKRLVKNLEPDWLLPTQKVGIRSQLIDWQSAELVMDFMVERAENSVHILNAISPAFTSSMAFAEYIVDEYITV